ncbi:MAG: prepilin-type N-terminal cleavage/methylation domain-containing protein [Candidatus Omnitrophica bacterium]|nr:prepilin-type N-terminal cleavage/methylation domain-containing protein [Candidatus Omnitrophota bacterium]
MLKNRNQNGFTLIEMIIAVVLLGLVLIPLGLMSTEYVRGIAYSRDLSVVEGLAKAEMAKINNLGYDNLPIGISTFENYEGYPYDLERTVTENGDFKKVQVRIYPAGDANKQLINLVSYIADVAFGAGSGGGWINIPHDPCFLAGTPILMADGSLKPIEQIKVGDKVIAFDQDTEKFKEDKVTELFHHKVNKYLIINDKIKVTNNHLVYSAGKWIEIGKLKVGDKLLNAEGKPEAITSIEKVSGDVFVYNFELNPYHAYVAGGIVAHNKKLIPISPIENEPPGGEGFD